MRGVNRMSALPPKANITCPTNAIPTEFFGVKWLTAFLIAQSQVPKGGKRLF